MSIIEQYFTKLDKMVERRSDTLNKSYMDALIDTMAILLVEKEDADDLSQADALFFKEASTLEIASLEKEQIRKIIEYAILKSMKDATQSQHLITPDTIASYISYLAEKLFGTRSDISIFDPVSGTANLLTAVINQLGKNVKAFGSEIDPALIQLGLLNANLQQNEIEFFHQDSIQPLLLDPVDLVVADLPVGFYPDDTRASQFSVSVEGKHTYAHHLLIEQSLHYTKPSGYLIFVIPNQLFSSDQATKLHALIQEEAHVIALLHLPASIFRSEKNAKSLFVLRKKSADTKAPKQALMAQLPSFKDGRATENMVNKMNQWFQEEGY
ncbi:site-specific DNA-methyltransferase (adenine-specific) [Amphibacillus marinus]|uniref:Site-specific DNA-methyltransferase (Adenine-specific) n=1 Tax=Amphibacillus marinus TaxID=872970 RepID=A0A1H8T1P9_9BACI|nr:class I SAM-dependent methyltransferase [Amphibacillus marinus]SEO84969.1 site-specific DNA-methyltransferase (adenine-specific) [Amphibacillus marinus]